MRGAHVGQLVAALIAGAALTAPAQAAPFRLAPGNSILVFGGLMNSGVFGQSLVPFVTPFESNGIVGGAIDHPWRSVGPWIHLDGELGLATRFGSGQPTSLEGWAGVRVRPSGWVVGATTITPSITFGLSAVTNTIGIETVRQRIYEGNATLLGYLRPEIDLSFAALPGVSLVYALQHRSGGGNVFGNMRDAANANIIGIRFQY